jgi:lipoprotein-anchoring transpeptidase ErfK/SrfK
MVPLITLLALLFAHAGSQAKQQTKDQESSTAAARMQENLALQVALDRAGFSPGVIDGRQGANTTRALEAYRRQNNADPDPVPEAVTKLRITAEDAAGPFIPDIPKELVDQAKLPALSYRSVDEMIGERYHTDVRVLRELNPGATFQEGEEILVPNVEPLIIPVKALSPAPAQTGKPTGTSGRNQPAAANAEQEKPAVVVNVSKASSALTVTDADGKIILFAPVTTGSERDPLPIGEWKVNGVQYNPVFHYNPDLFWDADARDTKATIPAGPNGPVGIVWIDISKDHYGIHGSPEPTQIGRSESHGCVRMTNWDALRVATLVRPGTRVIFTE